MQFLHCLHTQTSWKKNRNSGKRKRIVSLCMAMTMGLYLLSINCCTVEKFLLCTPFENKSQVYIYVTYVEKMATLHIWKK